jgi:hypothetical protein
MPTFTCAKGQRFNRLTVAIGKPLLSTYRLLIFAVELPLHEKRSFSRAYYKQAQLNYNLFSVDKRVSVVGLVAANYLVNIELLLMFY